MPVQKDLLILVADKNAQFALSGALARSQSLGIRPISFDFIVHPGRDGGVRKSGVSLLGLKKGSFLKALLVFDFEGCGTELLTATDLEFSLDQQLERDWGSNAKSIVIHPEVDIWMWGTESVIKQAINWTSNEDIRDWLVQHDFSLDTNRKPTRPKEAFEAVLRYVNLPRSSSLYRSIAQRTSLTRCQDQSFVRLKSQLQQWFPING